MLRVFKRLYGLVPLILMIATVGLTINGVEKKKHYLECMGVITGFYENSSAMRVDASETKAISPIVSYAVHGQSYEFVGNYYSTGMKIGDQVAVLYHEDDFSKATIKTGVYFAPLITGVLAVASLLPIIILAVLRLLGIVKF